MRDASADSLWMWRRKYTRPVLAVSWSEVRTLEVRRKYRSTIEGAFYGTLIGAGAGTIAGLAMPECTGGFLNDDFMCASDSGDRAAMAGVVTAVGLGLGAYIGSRSESERWQEVPVPPVRVSVGTRQATVALRLPLDL